MTDKLYVIASTRLKELKHRYDHRNDPPPVIVPPLNEDLSDMNEGQIRNEIAAVRERLKLGHVEPEGVQGLNYRLHKLMAQQVVVQRKEGKT